MQAHQISNIRTSFKAGRMVQRGFTLLELAIVVVIIGILGAIIAPSIMGSKEGANVKLLKTTATNIASNIMMIASTCGISTAAASNVLLDTGKTMEDVIFTGVGAVATAYKNCYGQSKVLPLTEVAQPGASAGTYNVGGYAVSITGGGTAATPLKVNYASVPDSAALLAAQDYNPALSTLAASDTTGIAFQYGTATGGLRTITYIKPVN